MKDLIIPYLEAFESRLLEAAIAELSNSSPLAFNSFCAACREVVTSALHRLAPDEEVRKCEWFTPDPSSKNGITRKHRVYYAVQGGLTDSYVQTELGLDISEMHRTLRKSVDDLSKFTHVTETTFATSSEEANERSNSILGAISDFFVTIRGLRTGVCAKLQEELDDAALQSALAETIIEIDELATHHYIEEIHCEEYVVTAIDSYEISIDVHGTIYVELQWGSNSDVRNDLGAVLPQQFPFTCTITAPLSDLDDLAVNDGFRVDVSSWRNAMEDHD